MVPNVRIELRSSSLTGAVFVQLRLLVGSFQVKPDWDALGWGQHRGLEPAWVCFGFYLGKITLSQVCEPKAAQCCGRWGQPTQC